MRQITHKGFKYGKKNFNLTNYHMDCIHWRSFNCTAQCRYPVVGGQVDMKKGWSCGQHSQKCALKNGLDPLSYSKDPKDDDSDDDDKKPAAVEKTYINITQEMKTKTVELATSKLTTTPESIWGDVVSWANCTYDGLWYRIKEQQVKDLVRKSHKKLGFGNAISTIENTPDYNKMTDQDRPYLHCSACFPHPEKPDTNMRMMIFANPYLLGLLKGLVDIFFLAGNVADMSRHVGNDTTCRSNFGPMGPCCRHKI